MGEDALRRFDQKNEVFKRALWDRAFSDSLSADPEFLPGHGDNPGYRPVDLALRHASWALEHIHGKANARSNWGLYSWSGTAARTAGSLKYGKPVMIPMDERAGRVKRAARFFGASLVGITRVSDEYVYTHEFDTETMEHRPHALPEGCRTAIVMAIEMDYEAMRSSPDMMAGAATGLGYSRMAFTAFQVAQFIRHLGYRAIPCGNDTALSIPLAIEAGLGELGRNGLLITKEFGPRVRLCKVFTDMEVPVDSFQPFGVEAFCGLCKKCAKACPSRSISLEGKTDSGPSERSSFSGRRKWYINPETCYSFWRKTGMDCSNCVRSCPFNQPAGWLHTVVRFFIRRLPLFNRAILLADTLIGSHSRKRPQ